MSEIQISAAALMAALVKSAGNLVRPENKREPPSEVVLQGGGSIPAIELVKALGVTISYGESGRRVTVPSLLELAKEAQRSRKTREVASDLAKILGVDLIAQQHPSMDLIRSFHDAQASVQEGALRLIEEAIGIAAFSVWLGAKIAADVSMRLPANLETQHANQLAFLSQLDAATDQNREYQKILFGIGQVLYLAPEERLKLLSVEVGSAQELVAPVDEFLPRERGDDADTGQAVTESSTKAKPNRQMAVSLGDRIEDGDPLLDPERDRFYMGTLKCSYRVRARLGRRRNGYVAYVLEPADGPQVAILDCGRKENAVYIFRLDVSGVPLEEQKWVRDAARSKAELRKAQPEESGTFLAPIRHRGDWQGRLQGFLAGRESLKYNGKVVWLRDAAPGD